MILTKNKKGILSVVGGVIIHLAIGAIYSFGLLNQFMASYISIYNSNVIPDDGFFLLPLGIVFSEAFIVVGGLMERRAGPIL